jgi:GIY-YIG catalytic domain
MHPLVAPYVNALDTHFNALLACLPMKINALPSAIKGPGIYLLSEGVAHLYVGRTDNLRTRLQQHQREGSKHNAAVFAFRLAREATGKHKASYRAEGSRAHIETDPSFAIEFAAAKERIRRMHVRTVSIADPVTQALLEIYTAVAVSAKYNNFENH